MLQFVWSKYFLGREPADKMFRLRLHWMIGMGSKPSFVFNSCEFSHENCFVFRKFPEKMEGSSGQRRSTTTQKQWYQKYFEWSKTKYFGCAVAPLCGRSQN